MYWVLVLLVIGTGSAVAVLPHHFQDEAACQRVLTQWQAGSANYHHGFEGTCLLMPREDGQ